MNTLIEKIASYKNATQNLIDKTKEAEDFIKKNVPFEFWKNFGLSKFGSQNYSWHFSVAGSPIPNKTEDFGKGFYWGGDFNDKYYFVTGKELIEWTKCLPELMAEAEAFVETLTKEIENI